MLPLQKFPEFYPGQVGVPGSDSALGLRTRPSAVVYYVDSTHGNRNDDNDGTDPNAPLATIQEAVNKVSNIGDIIILNGVFTEDVIVPPNGIAPSYVTIMGAVDNPFGCTWTPTSDAGGTVALTMQATGWRIANIRFALDAVNPSTGITLATNLVVGGAENSIIENCLFVGGGAADVMGINMGADRVTVRGCRFDGITDGADGAFGVGHPPAGALGAFCVYENNVFTGCDNDLDMRASCIVKGNVFDDVVGAGILVNDDATCIITANWLIGAYTTAKYTPTAGSWWIGNFTNPAGETVPGVTVHPCGLTIANPAA